MWDPKQDPDPDPGTNLKPTEKQDPNPKPTEKQDPDTDPKKSFRLASEKDRCLAQTIAMKSLPSFRLHSTGQKRRLHVTGLHNTRIQQTN